MTGILVHITRYALRDREARRRNLPFRKVAGVAPIAVTCRAAVCGGARPPLPDLNCEQ
jgi:hypothetical protein